MQVHREAAQSCRAGEWRGLRMSQELGDPVGMCHSIQKPVGMSEVELVLRHPALGFLQIDTALLFP